MSVLRLPIRSRRRWKGVLNELPMQRSGIVYQIFLHVIQETVEGRSVSGVIRQVIVDTESEVKCMRSGSPNVGKPGKCPRSEKVKDTCYWTDDHTGFMGGWHSGRWPTAVTIDAILRTLWEYCYYHWWWAWTVYLVKNKGDDLWRRRRHWRLMEYMMHSQTLFKGIDNGFWSAWVLHFREN